MLSIPDRALTPAGKVDTISRFRGGVTFLQIYFSDVFSVAPDVIDDYGAFNISLVNDLPLFIDPFLLFHSEDEAHRALHNDILTYLRFLRDMSIQGIMSDGLLRSWFAFPEVKQNWLGYSKTGNSGSGLGMDFARTLNKNLGHVFSSFGAEVITRSSHLEKLCLLGDGVGRDNISDFVTNLIKEYLLNYTQEFARLYLPPSVCKKVPVARVKFDFQTRAWRSAIFELPYYRKDFVILTPRSLLTRDDTWINASDMHSQFDDVIASIPNEQLRAELNQYILQHLPKEPLKKDYQYAEKLAIKKYPQIIDYFIRFKEDNGDEALRSSASQVNEVAGLFVQQIRSFVSKLDSKSPFYQIAPSDHARTRERVFLLKNVIEAPTGHEVFYVRGKPIGREDHLHVICRLIWFAEPRSQNPVDPAISSSKTGRAVVEFKLAASNGLGRSLDKIAEAPKQKQGDAPEKIHVIFFFSETEQKRALKMLHDLGLINPTNVVLIDASPDGDDPSTGTPSDGESPMADAGEQMGAQETSTERRGLEGPRRRALEAALLDAFRNEAELTRMVRIGLDKNLAELVALGKPLRTVVFDLMEAAEAGGFLGDLVRAAREENPGNGLLAEVSASFDR